MSAPGPRLAIGISSDGSLVFLSLEPVGLHVLWVLSVRATWKYLENWLLMEDKNPSSHRKKPGWCEARMD